MESAPGPVETIDGGVGTVPLSEPAVPGSEELGTGVLPVFGTVSEPVFGTLNEPVFGTVSEPVSAGDACVTSARASAAITSATTRATRISVSLRCVGVRIGLRNSRATPARPPRGEPAGASSEHQLVACVCPPIWPVKARFPAPL